jgi:hypothetical protein
MAAEQYRQRKYFQELLALPILPPSVRVTAFVAERQAGG